MKRALSRLAPLALLAAPGCGYTTGLRFPEGIRSVAVPAFGNETFRRGLEFDLTEAVARALLDRTDLRLAPVDEADAVVRGRLVNARTPVLVEGGRNRLLESASLLEVEVELVDRRSSRLLARLVLKDRAEIAPVRGEDRASGFRESIDTLAERIVLGLAEKGRVDESSSPPRGDALKGPPGAL